MTKDLMRRYDGVRHAQRRLNKEALSFLSRGQILAGAKELGVEDGGRLILRSEHEMTVLMDHCLYDLRRSDRTAIDRYLDQTRFPEGSPEADLAAAMRGASYSLFLVEDRRQRFGLVLRDLLTQDAVRLVDRNLSETADAGLTLATRILRFPDFAMTTGAALPFDARMARELRRRVTPWSRREKGIDVAHLTPRQQSRLATYAIRAALDFGASEYVDTR